MSMLGLGRGLDELELWLAGLFTAAELAAADLLLQLSVAKGIDDDDEAVASSSATTTSPSPRSSRPCDLTPEEDTERVGEEPAVSAELDRRATKRYRRLSELYAGTVRTTSPPYITAKKKRKIRHQDHDGLSSKKKRTIRHHDNDGLSSKLEALATRNGGHY